MKYDSWNIAGYDTKLLGPIANSGISPLAGAVLLSRGYDTPEKASGFLKGTPLLDPFLLPDMEIAADRVRQAVRQKETVAIYGDYDVDGITATCLMTEFIRDLGLSCVYYIPSRIDEGYGLNALAITRLCNQGVNLIITVDCGVTAIEEIELAKSLGMDVIVTDHHECAKLLPGAAAVVNPHRQDSRYPSPHLAGVGVAFKLACAVSGDEETLLSKYCDLLCLGTIADVMPLTGENRMMVCRGISALKTTKRAGLRMLIKESGVEKISSDTVSFFLAPRINAAGRMGKADEAMALLLETDEEEAWNQARVLCALNQERRRIEQEICDEAENMLAQNPQEGIIVLASENWHQGVVGIVASRLSQKYRRPCFLICLEGDLGKASARSWGGFNIYAALEESSSLLEAYGGHEMAAGFTIARDQIGAFREKIQEFMSRQERAVSDSLQIDCSIEDPELLSFENIKGLDILDPCGSGNPQPLFFMDRAVVESVLPVGGGKHLKLRISKAGKSFDAIFFSMTALQSGVAEGDLVELAFCPQINEFRGKCTVQLQLTDIRPEQGALAVMNLEFGLYQKHASGCRLDEREAKALTPAREEFAAVWRYLKIHAANGQMKEELGCLSRKIARAAGLSCSLMRTRICLDVFEEHRLIYLQTDGNFVHIQLSRNIKKVDLEKSRILIDLANQKRR